MIRIGANPIGWSNDDLPELGGEIPLDQCLREAKAAGMQGMELGHKFPRRVSDLKPILDRFGLALVGGWWSTFLLDREPQEEMRAAADHIALLKALGAKVFIAAECTRTVHGDRSKPLSMRPVMTDAESHRLNARLSEFAERLIDAGLLLVYHHHMGTVVQTGAEIERLMDGTGHAVSLLLDTGHATWGGADPAALARKYRMRIGHVHAKDVRSAQMQRAAAEDLSFLDAVIAGVYTVPGDGIVDFTAVLRELSDYSGWIVVEAEQYLGDRSPAEYAKLGHDNLVRYLAEAGLRR
jgi:inosose dehydratase